MGLFSPSVKKCVASIKSQLIPVGRVIPLLLSVPPNKPLHKIPLVFTKEHAPRSSSNNSAHT